MPCSYGFLYLLMAAAAYMKCSQGELWSVVLCLFLCSFTLSTSSVEKLASHCYATICSHHLNLPVTGLEKYNPACTVLSDTIFFLTPSDQFLVPPGSLCQLFSIFGVDSVFPIWVTCSLTLLFLTNTVVPQRFLPSCPLFTFALQLSKHEVIP